MNKKNNYEQEDSKIFIESFLNFFSLIINNIKVLFISIIVLILLLASTLFLPKYYISSVSFLLPNSDSFYKNYNTLSSYLDFEFSNKKYSKIFFIIEKYLSILNSELIYYSVIDQLDLTNEFNLKNRYDTLIYLKKLTKVAIKTFNKNTNERTIFTKNDVYIILSVETKNPKLSTEIANAFLEQFTLYNNKMNLDSLAIQKKFLNKKINEIKTEILNLEKEILKNKLNTSIVDLEKNTDSILEKIKDLDYYYTNLQIKKEKLNTYLNTNNTSVDSIIKSIETLKNELNRIKNNEYSNNLNASLIYKEIEINIDNINTIYSSLINKLEYIKLEEEKKYTYIKKIDYNIIPTKKSWPKYSILGISIFAIIFIFSFTYCYIKDFIYNKEITII